MVERAGEIGLTEFHADGDQAENNRRGAKRSAATEAHGEDLLAAALDKADAQVNQQEAPPPDFPFDYQAESPQRDHVANEMHDPAVDEIRCHPGPRSEATV